MDGWSISQVAERTGFSASALRFYDRAGLVSPQRTPAGYRRYDDDQVALLGFVKRAKGFGLSLDEIADLAALVQGERCAPVQGRLQEHLDAKVAEAQDRIAELVAFTAELQRVRSGLGRHTPDGPCDDRCGCVTDTATPVGPVGVALVPRPPAGAAQPPDPVTVARSIALFALAAVAEIGGAWLVWQGVRQHRGLAWVGAGVVALGAYGFIATLQPDSNFGRVLAAYGGVFVAGSLAWGVAVDRFRPDRWDLVGAAVCLAGVGVIMFAPRT